MRAFRRRTKVISFRLSEADYALIATLSRATGANSVADYARSLTCLGLNSGALGSSPVQYNDLESALQALSHRLTTICEELQSCAELLASASKEPTADPVREGCD